MQASAQLQRHVPVPVQDSGGQRYVGSTAVNNANASAHGCSLAVQHPLSGGQRRPPRCGGGAAGAEYSAVHKQRQRHSLDQNGIVMQFTKPSTLLPAPACNCSRARTPPVAVALGIGLIQKQYQGPEEDIDALACQCQDQPCCQCPPIKAAPCS